MLELVRRGLGLPVLTEAQAKEKTTPTGPFAVVSGSSFAVYKPWASMRELGRQGALSGDITLGPAVEGQVVREGAGSRVELRIRRYAPPPSQRLRFTLATAVFTAFVVLPLVLGGAHPVALGLSGLSLLGGVAAMLHRRREREQDVRELLATVERVLGPAEVGAADEGPHRRVASAAGDDS